MRIAVCLKAVPADQSLAQAGMVGSGDSLYALNEWDAYALEEALRIAEQCGGRVASFSAGGQETEAALRRALALGAASACRVAADGTDSYMVAAGLAACLREQGPWEMLLFGAQSSDRGGGQVGGAVAASLGLPYVALVTKLSLEDTGVLVERECEGRRYEKFRLAAPCAVSVQTGINAPRYVSVRGIQRAGRAEVTVFEPPAPAKSRVRFTGCRVPEPGSVTMLSGSAQEMAAAIAGVLRLRRGL